MKSIVLVLLVHLLGQVEETEAALPAASGPGTTGWTGSIQPPIGPPGQIAHYKLQPPERAPASTVAEYTVALGEVEFKSGIARQWLRLEATKGNGKTMRVWLLAADYPPAALKAARARIARYILQEQDSDPVEYRDSFTGEAVLPSLGAWSFLWPQSSTGPAPTSGTARPPFPNQTRYLGLPFVLERVDNSAPIGPPGNPRRIDLQPSLLIGVPSNTRQKEERRRYDNSDYELVKLTQADFREMARAGINCFRVDPEQLAWMTDLNAFYWGVDLKSMPFPESLYRSTYLGASLFLDEPAVGTRDYDVRPRLAAAPAFRKEINPQTVFGIFQQHFRHALESTAATAPLNAVKGSPELNLGDMSFTQANLFTWETMVSTAAYELSQDAQVPEAMVFEPPGRVGTFRTLPEMDMTYGCQIPVDDPKNFTDLIYGFLRGAARLTGKTWGTSIYGAVDRADAFWFLTHAYDLGASRFFFWDNSRIACVPYGECLALARALRSHAENFPVRDLERLNHAAEIAILLPPGYNLGHVQLGKGSLWGVPELNLERTNRMGVKYRAVMASFFAEIERSLRLGIAFDLLWDLPTLQLPGYREVVRIREDGKVEVVQSGKARLLKKARVASRPEGLAPELVVEASPLHGRAPLPVAAQATVHETTAPVFYTYGTDKSGVYHNAMVAWELYGPDEWDYRSFQPENLRPIVNGNGGSAVVKINFTLPRPGHYRLRAATVDMAGRTTVRWTSIEVRE